MKIPNKTNNVFALILVLVISLITNPVFGMPGHQASMTMMAPSAPPSVSQPTVTQLSEGQASAKQSDKTAMAASHCHPSQQNTEHVLDQALSQAPSKDSEQAYAHSKQSMNSCQSNGDMALCSHCSPSHCQSVSGDLPINPDCFSARFRDHQIPPLAAAHPISRTESLLRPPIR